MLGFAALGRLALGELAAPGQTLSASLHNNLNGFFVQVVTQRLTASLYTDPDSFFAPNVALGVGGGQVLTPTLYNDPDTFFAPTVAQITTLMPGVYTDPDIFFVHTIVPAAINLAPALFSDPDTFFNHFVSLAPTPGIIAPTLFTNQSSFIGATIGITIDVRPPFYSDPDSFFAPSVAVGGVTLYPFPLLNRNTFFTHTLTGGIPVILLTGRQHPFLDNIGQIWERT